MRVKAANENKELTRTQNNRKVREEEATELRGDEK